MSPLAAYGLLAHAVIFGAFVALLPFGAMRPRVALAATAMSLLTGLAPTLHGLLGAPSVTLLLLALLHVADRLPQTLAPPAAAALLALGTLFYPLALGFGPFDPFDPYTLGYTPWPLFACLLPIALALWWRGAHLALWLLAGDLAAYATGIFDNVWDVLIDPLLMLLALAVVLRHLALRISARALR